ncbi:MAG: hypothetical protein ACLSVD_05765 [Eggerthellaceae bacterium]
MATTGMVIVTGEIRTQAYVDVRHRARGAARHRLRPREVRLRLRHLRRAERHPRPEPRHRAGRRRELEAQHGLDEGDPYERVGAGDRA